MKFVSKIKIEGILVMRLINGLLIVFFSNNLFLYLHVLRVTYLMKPFQEYDE